MIQSSDQEAESTEADRKIGWTHLNFTVVTVSDATLFPTSFAPVSILDQTVEKPAMIKQIYHIWNWIGLENSDTQF